MSGIDTLLERLDSQALDGLYESLVGPFPQFEIGSHHVLDDIGDLRVGDGGSEQRAELRVFVGPAAEGDLVEFLAVLLDAENADMADMVMAAGIDATRNIDVQTAEVAGEIEIAEAAGQLLGDRYGAGIGEAAIVEARTGDDVGDEPDIGRCHADGVEGLPQGEKFALRHMGEHQVLLMADPDLAERIAV